jgi:hypothetical protein
MRRGLGLVVAALAAAVLAGCGEEAPRDRVGAYLDAVNAVQRDAGPRFAEANTAFRDFAEGKVDGRRARFRLRKAETDIDAARRRLAAIGPPAEARRLHGLVQRYFEMSVLLAAETRQLAEFLPAARRDLARLEPSRRRLRRDLRVGRGPAAQEAALRAYAGSLGGVLRRLGALRPPPALAADHETQQRKLRAARRLALDLARAIAARDALRVEALLSRFGEDRDPRPDLARLGRGALRAYRQRLGRLQQAGADVQAERSRVARRLS